MESCAETVSDTVQRFLDETDAKDAQACAASLCSPVDSMRSATCARPCLVLKIDTKGTIASEYSLWSEVCRYYGPGPYDASTQRRIADAVEETAVVVSFSLRQGVIEGVRFGPCGLDKESSNGHQRACEPAFAAPIQTSIATTCAQDECKSCPIYETDCAGGFFGVAARPESESEAAAKVRLGMGQTHASVTHTGDAAAAPSATAPMSGKEKCDRDMWAFAPPRDAVETASGSSGGGCDVYHCAHTTHAADVVHTRRPRADETQLRLLLPHMDLHQPYAVLRDGSVLPFQVLHCCFDPQMRGWQRVSTSVLALLPQRRMALLTDFRDVLAAGLARWWGLRLARRPCHTRTLALLPAPTKVRPTYTSPTTSNGKSLSLANDTHVRPSCYEKGGKRDESCAWLTYSHASHTATVVRPATKAAAGTAHRESGLLTSKDKHVPDTSHRDLSRRLCGGAGASFISSMRRHSTPLPPFPRTIFILTLVPSGASALLHDQLTATTRALAQHFATRHVALVRTEAEAVSYLALHAPHTTVRQTTWGGEGGGTDGSANTLVSLPPAAASLVRSRSSDASHSGLCDDAALLLVTPHRTARATRWVTAEALCRGVLPLVVPLLNRPRQAAAAAPSATPAVCGYSMRRVYCSQIQRILRDKFEVDPLRGVDVAREVPALAGRRVLVVGVDSCHTRAVSVGSVVGILCAPERNHVLPLFWRHGRRGSEVGQVSAHFTALLSAASERYGGLDEVVVFQDGDVFSELSAMRAALHTRLPRCGLTFMCLHKRCQVRFTHACHTSLERRDTSRTRGGGGVGAGGTRVGHTARRRGIITW